MNRLAVLLLAGALVALMLQPVSPRVNKTFDNMGTLVATDGAPPPPFPTTLVATDGAPLPPFPTTLVATDAG